MRTLSKDYLRDCLLGALSAALLVWMLANAIYGGREIRKERA